MGASMIGAVFQTLGGKASAKPRSQRPRRGAAADSSDGVDFQAVLGLMCGTTAVRFELLLSFLDLCSAPITRSTLRKSWG